ncbi:MULTISPECIES: translational GTPase TypA [Marichromatium]|uniref:Large ribosomal subunit assembly factor BipA n=1 Tax=Marichromatium gracile TaxID=1048 RepID=A0A4R4AK63_MARGR|nr:MULTISPECIES: translational GTPase TypA [Marichromatium]MBO8087174.1 translational GTPase TypA [Marichromatium sp.]TCW39803.1 GTP-binding protein [Marichromatium gracile]
MSSNQIEKLRNIAIIAHVDHGKTTLVDQLLQQSGTLGERFGPVERVMDSNALEKERGITILSKNTAIRWNDYRINIVDTPGHADFGGEVERVLSMVDSVLLLVDAREGPMPQTRFVTSKAFAHGLRPIVVVNKIDRPGARPDWVIDQVFDLFDRLGATDEQLDFPIVYASALNGYAGLEDDVRDGDMSPLFQAIVEHCPAPEVKPEAPFQMQVSTLDYNAFVGAIAVGRIRQGSVRPNQQVTVVKRDGTRQKVKIGLVYGYLGLDRHEVDSASAGDIVALTGIEAPNVSDTLCDPDHVEPMTPLTVDEPTVTMTFQVNTSPFAGREGKYLTSRQLKDRLQRELIHNVALRVEEGNDPEKFRVSGRGELHLSILLENMRREGYELAVSRPEVIFREIDGEICEPYEQLTVDVDEECQGAIMQALGERRAELKDMVPDGKGRVRLDYEIPSRGLIGFQTEFMSLTSGTGLKYHVFERYRPATTGGIAERRNGALISNATGKALGYALFNLQERGRMLVSPGDEIYEGQVVGIHSRDNDLTVNPLKAKQLTNIRAAGSDENILLTPPVKFTLEQALEFIEDDELVEITPNAIRVRKRHLTEQDRKRASRGL